MNHQHVVAAAVFNERNEVLLALRPQHKHQGGLWEFPGGKVESGEDAPRVLVRELREELNIVPTRMRPLIRIRHQYPNQAVLLDVWCVDAWHGAPHPHDAQRLEWVTLEQLVQKQFPAANLPIVSALRLPPLYLITGEPAAGSSAFLATLERCLRGGARLVQLRAKTLDAADYRELAQTALGLCHKYSAQLVLNAAPELARELNAHGVHLSSARLMQLTERPLNRAQWVAASCHNSEELAHAQRIGVDFVVLSPVLPTRSHPGAATLGWEGLQQLCEECNVPAYALGGMKVEHLHEAWRHGAQGLALLSTVWDAAQPEQVIANLL
ncbi:MAG: Nudix family hydrolase [Proteobacteria bacterium]|nr:Nudix family hydrolase [Pseudomonadota bacterium]